MDHIFKQCSNHIGGKKVRQLESEKKAKSFEDELGEKARTNLNDLLEKRRQEKKSDKKTNLFIISGASVLATAVLILSL